ncbi:hypothetical protein QMK33_15890 [Hymenobacter sp. H14-R3]|uniref:hypothetical protein n=1 Tax=Hymenobacter sp. H14-R3 TaxID=3046308 RepID=UPI0024BA31DA|nr:hypothetical protein [Hymenobacter sp. H14-R3]MDJ0366639.1 hypothetical protein [Hymenobacter sp. H14-R3]
MRTLPRLFGLFLLGMLSSLLLLSSCETTRTSEDSNPANRSQRVGKVPGASLSGSAASHQVMQLDGDGKVKYKLAQSVMAAALIRQFNDGTVIDRVQVRKAPGSDAVSPVYYLIGLGHNKGSYRAIALPLRATTDSTYYLAPSASRYVISGVGCPSCYFDFEDGHIIGTTCDDNSGGSSCTMQILPANQVFAKTMPDAPTVKPLK